MNAKPIEKIRIFAHRNIALWREFDPWSKITTRQFYADNFLKSLIRKDFAIEDVVHRYENINRVNELSDEEIFRSKWSTDSFSFYIYDRENWLSFVSDFDEHIHEFDLGKDCKVALLGSGNERHTLYRYYFCSQIPRKKFFALQAPLVQIIRDLLDFQPHIISGYGSLIDLIVLLNRSDQIKIAPVAVHTHTDALSDDARDYIVKAWGVRPRKLVSTTELGVLATECAAGRLHLNMAGVHAEKIAQRLVFTNLRNRFQPILNFDLGDGIDLVEGPCECGDASPLLAMSAARRHALLRLLTKDSEVVPMHSLVLRSALDWLPSVRDFRAVQAGDMIDVVVFGHCNNDEVRELLYSAVRAYCYNANLDFLNVRFECPV